MFSYQIFTVCAQMHHMEHTGYANVLNEQHINIKQNPYMLHKTSKNDVCLIMQCCAQAHINQRK